MKKFSLNELFPTETDKEHNTYRYKSAKPNLFDIDTLFNNKDETDIIFDSHTLLKNTEEIKKKLDKYYNKSFKECCKIIKIANNHNITDTIFDVSAYSNDCYEYKSSDCLLFIENKLNEQSIDTYIINETKIFITWKNLEQKLLQKKNIADYVT
jgi:hypothetical protein